MSKVAKAAKPIDAHDEAFEMIELAIGDLDTLTRAFDLISEICETRDVAPHLSSESPPKNLVN